VLKRDRERSQAIILLGDLLFLVLTVFVAEYIRIGLPLRVFFMQLKAVTVVFCFSTAVAFYIADLYDVQSDPKNLRQFVLLTACIALGTSSVAFTFYLLPRWKLSRGIFLLMGFVGVIFAYAWRLVWFRVHQAVRTCPRIGVIGGKNIWEELERVGAQHRMELVRLGDPAGNISTEAGSPASSVGDGRFSRLKDIRFISNLDAIVIPGSGSLPPELVRSLVDVRFAGVAVYDLPAFVESVTSRLPVEYLDDSWFLAADGFQFFESGVALRIKRFADVTFAALLALATAPLFPIIAVGIKLSSRGPVFYTQERVGRGEEVFRMFKFRSMRTDSEQDRPVWATKNDPRTFPWGRFLRLTHLDEVPQLINVLRGDMSFVGPRPERPAFVQELKQILPYYGLRSAVRPGLTGWTQVNCAYGASVEDHLERTKYDLYYVRHVSLLLDLKIVLKTVRAVLTRQGSR
jgi:exopolysaccharide biosynthesis polyprenyl glycosylphosphotransferase